MEKDDIIIDENDLLCIQVIGYSSQGESIIVSIGNKFLGVIDCFKKKEIFKTKEIVKEMGIPLDFICWTHSDWDHTYGLSELKEFTTKDTAFIVPFGFQAKELRDLLSSEVERNYKFEEYNNIYHMINEVEAYSYIGVNENTEIYNFNLLYGDQTYNFMMKSFAPVSKIVHTINGSHIKKIIEDKNEEEWLQSVNSDNNLFSVGLSIAISNGENPIRVCLTGDITNETIREMHPLKKSNIFLKNTFLKIPHHCSEYSDELINWDDDKTMMFEGAVTTSYRLGKSYLPDDEVMKSYRKAGNTYWTNIRDDISYGIVKCEIPILKNEKMIVSFDGGAGQCVG